MRSCPHFGLPTATLVAQFQAQRLAGSESDQVKAHLATCPECSELLAALASSEGAVPLDEEAVSKR